MATDQINDIVPDQHTGAKTDAEHKIIAENSEQAGKIYERARQRLLDVNHWHELCGKASAKFTLTDDNGNEVSRPAQINDHFKINIPAPGNTAGEGYDWVKIEAIEESENGQMIAVRVRPAPDPRTPGEEIAHFFKDAATSTFTVERTGNEVMARVHGRNEEPNTTAEKVLDKVRNAIVAIGAMIGLSTPQWQSLVKGLLEPEKN
jgi:hypothetical protein